MDKIPESLKPARFAALDLLRDYNIITPPVNITKIIKSFGLSIFEFNFPEDANNISGMLDLDEKAIYINEDEEDFNKSFTTAHELGHFVLHKKFIKKYPEKYSFVFKKRGGIESNDELEREANCFARNLLVPKFMLDEYKNSYSIAELAIIFGVSPLLIEKRLTQEY